MLKSVLLLLGIRYMQHGTCLMPSFYFMCNSTRNAALEFVVHSSYDSNKFM